MFIIPMTPMSVQTSILENNASTQIKPNNVGIQFADVLSSTIQNTRELQAIAQQDAIDLAMGKTDDLHNVMINAQKATTALELTVSLTSKAVNAYNEIMRMQF